MENPKYTEVFSRLFPQCSFAVEWDEARVVDHLLIDLSALLHRCANVAPDESTATDYLKRELADILRRVRPQKSVGFSLDGPVPLAKLALQRKRIANIQRRVDEDKRLSLPSVHPYRVTAGSSFMVDCDDALEEWAKKVLSEDPFSRVRGIKVYFSSSLVPGEGEIKLIEIVHRICARDPSAHGDSFCFVGVDSDLLLSALACSHICQVYFWGSDCEDFYSIPNISSNTRPLEDNSWSNSGRTLARRPTRLARA